MVNTTPIICDPKYSGRVTWSDSAQFEWEVLCYQMVILKDNYNVHFKFYFEVGGLQSGASEQSREYHVNGDGEGMADIPLSNLNVLDLCGISGVAFSTTTGLHSYKL